MLTDIDMFMMVEKGMRGRICDAICNQEEANNKYMKDHNKDKES